MKNNKQTLILLSLAFFVALFVVIMAVSSFFRTSEPVPSKSVPTATPVPYTKNNDGVFIFTPLQKTDINKTTAKEVEEKNRIISKSQLGSVTIYTVPSATVDQTDEIRTKDGLVTFESTNIFNKKTGGYPPKASVYEKEFGKPEKILKGVSPLGQYISAYIYAKSGFTLFVNQNTTTVYVVQRFIPMSLELYEKTYAEYLQPAPNYPPEAPYNQ